MATIQVGEVVASILMMAQETGRDGCIYLPFWSVALEESEMEGCMREGGKGINELTGLSLSSVLCFPEGQLEAREGCNNTLWEERACPILAFQVTVHH